MRFTKEERDTINFCAESLAALTVLKGNSEVTAGDMAKALKEIVSGQSEVKASIVDLAPKYNQAADIVVAAIYDIVNGYRDSALKMFATIIDADDCTDLAASLMQYNEAAVEAQETKAFATPLDGDSPGDTPDDFIDENQDLGPAPDDASTTMDNEEPLLDDGEQDVLFYDPDGVDSVVEDEPIDGDSLDLDDVDEVIASAMDNEENEDDDIKPCSTDPVTDRALKPKRDAKNKDDEGDEKSKKVLLTHPGDESNEKAGSAEKKVEARISQVLSSSFVKSLDKDTKRQIIATVNKISMPGRLKDKKDALAFLNTAVNSLSSED